MRKILLIGTILFFSSCKKEAKEMPIDTDLSMVEITVAPSFYGSKKFFFDIEHQQLFFRNLNSDVNDSSIYKASENRIFQLTHHETDSLLSLCKNLKSSYNEIPASPDQWIFYAIAVKKNKELIEILDGMGTDNLLHAIIFLIRKKCKDKMVHFELKRFS